MKPTIVRRAIAIALVAGGLTACGGDYGSTAEPKSNAKPVEASAQALSVKAVEKNGLAFDRTELKAKPGTVTINFENPDGAAPHAIGIEGNGVDKLSDTVAGGATTSVTATLKPGTYTFYCPVPGHRGAGMEGTLTVGSGGDAKAAAPKPAAPSSDYSY